VVAGDPCRPRLVGAWAPAVVAMTGRRSPSGLDAARSRSMNADSVASLTLPGGASAAEGRGSDVRAAGVWSSLDAHRRRTTAAAGSRTGQRSIGMRGVGLVLLDSRALCGGSGLPRPPVSHGELLDIACDSGAGFACRAPVSPATDRALAGARGRDRG